MLCSSAMPTVTAIRCLVGEKKARRDGTGRDPGVCRHPGRLHCPRRHRSLSAENHRLTAGLNRQASRDHEPMKPGRLEAFVIALLMALGGVLSACGFSNTFNYG